jgi:hypothetical protein
MYFVQRMHRRLSLCGVKLLGFLTIAPLGKSCLCNAPGHFSSRTIMTPPNKTVNKLCEYCKEMSGYEKAGYLLSSWIMSVFSRVTLTHAVCLELTWLSCTLQFQRPHSVTHYEELTVSQNNTYAHNLNFIHSIITINNNKEQTFNHN